MKQFLIERKIYCKMYLALNECVNNSIIHGNKLNPKKKVKVKFENNDDHFRIVVNDEGLGFNYNIVNDPREKRNLCKESGRGIFIMKQYADKVRFENNGATVQLIFNK